MIFLPPNSANLTHPCDKFFIQDIKYAQRKAWDSWKAARVLQEEFRNGVRKYWKIEKPGNYFQLKLIEQSLREVRLRKYQDDIYFAGKAMIRFGISLEKYSVEGRKAEDRASKAHSRSPEADIKCINVVYRDYYSALGVEIDVESFPDKQEAEEAT